MSPYENLIRAAEWAERAPVWYHYTAPPLRALAARVLAGEVDLSDMPDAFAARWSGVLVYLDTKGIDIAGSP